MKIYTTDEMDDSDVTVTPTTENTQFPAVNVQNFQPTKRWHTLGTITDETLTMDLDEATLIDTFIVVGHNFDGTETTVKIQGNATDSWGAPTVDETITVVVGEPFKTTFSGMSLRFWRFIFTKASASDVKKVGRLWLGNEIDTGQLGDPSFKGVAPSSNDRSLKSKSIGGQTYIEVKNKFESFVLPFNLVPETAMSIYVTQFGLMGTSTPFFIVISSQAPLGRVWYVIATSKLTRPVEAFDSQFHWKATINLEEII